MRKKTIEEKYTELSEREHILRRSGMYVGSTKDETVNTFIYNDDFDKMELRDVTYVPAMLKIFDEILSNSCDEFRREGNMGLTKVEVTIHKEGKIIVRDNGGIPVEMHKTAGCYVPEFIFGRLRTSSNYDDTENRMLVGTNGVGSALANVFSSKFVIDCADGKNSYHRSWSENMGKLNDDLKVKPCKDHYTQTTFYPDFKHFDVDYTEFTTDFIDIVEKRCIDAAAATPGLKVYFKYYEGKECLIDNNWNFKKFTKYTELYSDYINAEDSLTFADNEKQVWIYPGDESFNVGFVDGALCSKGTHINAIRLAINKSVQEKLAKKNIDVTYGNISNKYAMFCIVNVVNPAYNSQTKEELTTPADLFSKEPGYKFTVPDKFLTKCQNSEIVELVMDWYQKKKEADDVKAIRKLNRESGKGLRRPDKFIACSSKNKNERQLWIFEGDSAKAAFRTCRDPYTQAGLLMRGVPKNAYDATPIQIMKNDVYNDIVNVLGLKFGDEFNIDDLKYGKIVISSDMDDDGHHIAGLLLAFFNHWPELFERGIVVRSISPIIIARKGKEVKNFYKLEDYRKEADKLKGWTFKYTKGLGGLSNSESKEMYLNPKFEVYKKDDLTDDLFKKWFGDDTNIRKKMLQNS